MIQALFGVAGLKLLYVPITLATSILLARGLGPESYGKITFLISVVTFASLPIGGALKQLLTREFTKYRHVADWRSFRGAELRATHFVALITLVVFIPIAYLIFNPTLYIEQYSTIAIISASAILPFVGLTAIRTANLRSRGFTILAQAPELFVKPITYLLLICMLYATDALTTQLVLTALLIATMTSYSLGAFFLSLKRNLNREKNTPAFHDRAWASAIVPFTLMGLLSTLNSQIGIFILGYQGKLEEVAILRIASSGAALVQIPLGIVNIVIAPKITEYFFSRDYKKLDQLYRKSTALMCFTGGIIALTFFLGGDRIITFLYGQEYSGTVYPTLAILLIGQIVNIFFGSTGMFLTMTGNERSTTASQMYAAFFTISLAWILVQYFGAAGAAFAITSGMILRNLFLARKFKEKLRLSPTPLKCRQ